MYKTLLLLTALALVQARPNEDAVVTNAKLNEIFEAVALSSNADDCDTLENGCPVDYTILKLIPHEQNCKLFYLCDKGEKVLLPCPEPLYFDAVTQRCDWKTDCVNNYNTDPPADDTEPITVADDIEDTTAADDIEDTTAADDTELITAADDIEDITTADDVEATTANGILDIGDVLENGCPVDIHIHHLLPHEECEKFYQCNFGEKVERDCAPGTVFHFEIQVCDWPRNVPRCAGSAGATARPPTTPDSEESPATSDPGDWEALPNGCPVNSSIPHLLPHESECDKYYVCDNGRLIAMGCPTATHFSPSLQKCTWPHEAGCEHWTGGGCSNPGSTCGGSTATPSDSNTTDSNISTTPSEVTSTTTELPCDTEGTIIDSSTTPDGPTDGNEEITDPTLPGDGTTIDSTTTDLNISTTPTVIPENSTTEAVTIESTTLDYEITTELLTVVTEDSTTTAAPIDLTTDKITTEFSTEAPETTITTTEGPLCDTEVPEDPVLPEQGTTGTPGCPICPTVPVSPAERCKQGCNVAPWAHEECDKYYSCIGDEFRLNICAEGLHFNPSTLTCDFICNAGCVRNVPQITRFPDGVLMFVPNIFNSKMNMMELIEHELNGDL